MTENEISKIIVEAAIEVHRTLGGPGLLESVYQAALRRELLHRGLAVKSQVAVPVLYKGERLDAELRLDLLVEDKVIVEVKASQENNPVFKAQLLTYLRLTGRHLGLVVNFGMKRVAKEGTHRVVNGLPE